MNKKFFIAILSHRKSNFREGQRKYLLENNRDRFIIYYFIGDPSLEDEYAIDKINNIVYLNIPDNYESLPQKTYGAVKFALENFSDQIYGLLKTDDDIELDLDKICPYLRNHREIPYCGITTKIVNPNNLSYWHMGKCESEELNRTPHRVPLAEYCAGGGYYLNLESMQKIVGSRHMYDGMIFEDAATGYVLNSHGIYPETVDLTVHGFKWEGIIPLSSAGKMDKTLPPTTPEYL
jgi:hypothetical protein